MTISSMAPTPAGAALRQRHLGQFQCVLAGDWFYMQAFRVALEERNFKVLDLLIGLTQQMVEGELLQMEKLGRLVNRRRVLRPDLSQNSVPLPRLHALGCGAGGRFREMEEQMGEYGRNLGIAFQIVDDLLDLTATEEVLGKPVASDLREGKATLAVVHAYQHGSAREREAIDAVLEDLNFERTSHQQILAILRHHGSVEYALAAAFQYAETARAALTRRARLGLQARPAVDAGFCGRPRQMKGQAKFIQIPQFFHMCISVDCSPQDFGGQTLFGLRPGYGRPRDPPR